MDVIGVVTVALSLAGLALAFGTALRIQLGASLSVSERCCTAWGLTWISFGAVAFPLARLGVFRIGTSIVAGTGLCLLVWQLVGPQRKFAELAYWTHDPLTRRIWKVQGLASALLIGLVSIQRTVTVMGWRGDWEEHWQRTQWLIVRGNLATTFAGGYAVPARPPLTNAVVAGMVAPFGFTWHSYLIALGLVSSMVVLPLMTLAGHSALRMNFWVNLLLVVSTPALVVHTMFPWTKLSSACLVLSAFVVHRRVTRRYASRLALLEGVLLAGAILSHYSGVVFAVVAGIDVLRRQVIGSPQRSWRNLARPFWSGLGAAIVLGPWVAWSYRHYGSGTWDQTSTVSTASGPLLLRLPANVFANLFIWAAEPTKSSVLTARDTLFAIVATNAVGAAGFSALIAIRAIKRQLSAWSVALVIIAFVTGTATLPEAIRGGAHVVLVPLSLCACSCLLVVFPTLGLRHKRAVIGGAVVQWLLLAGFHAYLQMYPNPNDSRYLAFDSTRRRSLNVRTIGESLGRPVGQLVWLAIVLIPLTGVARRGLRYSDNSSAQKLNSVSDHICDAASTTDVPSPPAVVDSVGSTRTPVSAPNTAAVESVNASRS